MLHLESVEIGVRSEPSPRTFSQLTGCLLIALAVGGCWLVLVGARTREMFSNLQRQNLHPLKYLILLETMLCHSEFWEVGN